MHSFQPPLGSLNRLTARILLGWQHPALGDLRQTPDHRLHSTVGQDPVRAPTSQFVPPTSQTEAVSAQKPLLPDQPNRQMPTPKQAQLSEQEALGWPQARMGPARSWAEPSLFQMWWGHGQNTGPDTGPVDMGREGTGPLWPRSYGLLSTQQLERETVLLNEALIQVKPPRFMRAHCLALAGLPPRFIWSCSPPKEPVCPSVPGNSERTHTARMGSAMRAAHPVSPGGPSVPISRAPGVEACQGIGTALMTQHTPSVAGQMFQQ